MKKLEQVKELVLRIGGKLTRLTKYGFVRYRNGKGSISCIYIHRKKGIVVKRPFLTYAARSKDGLPQHAVPTVIVNSPRHGWDELKHIFIQPLVDVSDDAKSNAYSCIYEQVPHPVDFKYDNCGMYRGEPVIIDW